MDNRPRIQKATRFFARPENFTLECPRCGIVYQVRGRKKVGHWDPTTSLFRCEGKDGCQLVCVIGLIAWPVSPRAWIRSPPRDQVPNPRQLAQLRTEGGGWWMTDEEKQRYEIVHESNITLQDERPEEDDE